MCGGDYFLVLVVYVDFLGGERVNRQELNNKKLVERSFSVKNQNKLAENLHA